MGMKAYDNDPISEDLRASISQVYSFTPTTLPMGVGDRNLFQPGRFMTIGFVKYGTPLTGPSRKPQSL
jgi:hypothetical protein